RLDAAIETAQGEQHAFADLEGHVTLVSMFYASCPHVCPMLIATIRTLETQLSPEERAALRVALFSVDPARDTPESLRALAQRQRVDTARWTLARTSPDSTRALAAVLGIRYKALPDGSFNHTSVIVLLDAEGRELARSSRLGVPD